MTKYQPIWLISSTFKSSPVPGWILSLWEDLQQLVIGQEEEAGEIESLLLQVFIQTLENEFQQLVTAFHLF